VIHLRAGSATDAGRVRANNQDRCLITETKLFAVADGMGGHRGGEVAAQMIIDELASSFGNNTVKIAGSEELVRSIEAGNRRIFERAAVEPDLFGMGTTVTAMALLEPASPESEPLLSVLNIGDSRTYLLRSGELLQVTEDHSLISEMLRSGEVTAEEAKTHRKRSILTRAIGVERQARVDVIEVLPVRGDRYLLCSDGLYGEVANEVIGSTLRRIGDPTDAAKELLRLALQHGGRDNITVIVVDVDSEVDTAMRASQLVGSDTGVDPIQRAEAVPTASRNSADDTKLHRIESHQASAASKSSFGNSAPDSASAVAHTTGKGRAKKPWPINIRVIAFFALLAGLGYAVLWIVRNAPTDEAPPIVVESVANNGPSVPASTTPAGPQIPGLGDTTTQSSPATQSSAATQSSVVTQPTATTP
jgi:PPM family protein phosphatase